MNIKELKSSLGDYAKDVKINLGNILNLENSENSQSQILGAALACAYATKEKKLIQALENEAATILTKEELNASKIAATLMAMNNIYYRFLHLISDQSYAKLPVGLRMQGIVNNGINIKDFEFYSLAVSVLNGCGMCVDSHVKQLEKHGMSPTQIQLAAKIAAVINSTAQALAIN